jgi:isoquinoline 1-oxidoreductase beta subunit
VNRRTFLQVGVSGAGGLLIAFTVGCKDKDAPAPAPAPTPGTGDAPAPARPAGADLNAWIRIDPDDTVTMLVPEAEMGQGIHTGVAMILAEELDADWATVRAEHAPADGAKYGRQSTGGSTSTRGNWDALRTAGATARAMLIAAAAQQWSVPGAELTTEPGAVVHAASKRRARYGELAAAAAKLPPPAADTITPRAPGTYRLIGKPTKRLDQRPKITGAATYGLDVRLPGMLFAVVARPPVVGGKLVKFDGAAARAIPGVKDVLQIPTGVAVVATSTWAALKGREALAVTWDDGAHAALTSEQISKTLRDLAPGGVTVKQQGDAPDAVKRARTKLTAAYEVPYLAHAPMEPLNATCDVEDGRCTLWVGTQTPSGCQKTAAEILAIPPEQVTVHSTFLGGGFGRRSQTDYVAEAVHVARSMKGPVQLVWTREDDTRGGFYRPAALSLCEGALDADGWPTAWVQRIAAPSILERFGPLEGGIDATAVEGVENLPYALPHLLVTYARPDLPISTWFWRSVGSSQNAWSTECFLDELARAGGKDPLEVRRRLLKDKPRHLAVLEAAAARAGWGAPLPEGRARGLAVHESFGSVVAEVAEVSIDAGAPRVHRVTCAIDCGTAVNPAQIEAQMESGILYGLSAALHGAIHLDGGKIRESNFHDYPVVRMREAPRIDTVIVASTDKPGGVGEPSTPPVAPAVCNALLALTGKPVRALPIRLG